MTCPSPRSRRRSSPCSCSPCVVLDGRLVVAEGGCLVAVGGGRLVTVEGGGRLVTVGGG